MSTKSKLQRKVEAIRKVEKDLTDKEARAVAKRSKMIRLKKKRHILRGPKGQTIGTITMNEGSLRLTLADGVELDAGGPGHVLDFVLPAPPEKKKKEKKPKPAAAPVAENNKGQGPDIGELKDLDLYEEAHNKAPEGMGTA